MATTTKKNTSSASAKPKTTKKDAEVQVETVVEATEPVEEPKKQAARAAKPVKLDDSVRVIVQSNVHGGLIFINQRTGDRTEWDRFGEKQTLTMGDLRSMKGTQRAFFENNWIFVDSVDEDGYEDVTPEDIYKSLLVTQYYKDSLTPDTFGELFRMSPTEIKERVHRLSADAKTNLIVAANDAIRTGTLDSLRAIQAIEDALNCELVTIDG
jgi:hypothetical protein